MKKLILIVGLAITSAASAATVGITTGTPAQTIKLSNGSFVTTSAWVRVGFFRGLNTEGLNGSDALASIAANFVPLGEAGSPAGYGTSGANTIAFNDTTHSIGGGINDISFGTGTANTEAAGALSRGTRLFLLIYDSKTAPTELGVFSATNWNVPASTLVNTANLTLTGVDTAGEVYRGSLGSLVLSPLVPIPEPSTGLLGLLAGLGLIARRRR